MDKNKHKNDWDDGRTIAPMNGDELPNFRRMAYLNRKAKTSKEERRQERNKYTKKEQRAMIRAGLLAWLPRMAVIVIGFVLAFLIVYFWLKPTS